jgi:nicotinamidase-related amidase
VTKPDPATAALLVIDVQKAFADAAYWGRRDNPGCERNIAVLLATWRAAGGPIVFVRHDSGEPDSPLRPGRPGNALQDILTGTPDLLVAKDTNSAFYGDPDLHAWLQERDVADVVICGITTNHCCETTARMAGNLGYATTFVIDATHTFDRRAPDGEIIPAELISRVTAANLDGEFATVVQTAALSGA